MNAARSAEILRHLERSNEAGADADLLARFVAAGDPTAFAELVRRHGPLVLGVCRRVTGHAQDAEDAFQATFLVLAQKARSLNNAALLGNWLYGVSFRVAWRAKRSARRRRAREVPVSVLPEPSAAAPSPATPELVPILDEELASLPACYRDAVVLCDLRGASRTEAAAALGIPEGTLSSRLANGRKKLAARLTKRGVALSAATLPAAVSGAQAATSVPNDLVNSTCGLVADYAARGVIPGPLARLTEGGFAVRKSLMLGAVMVVAVAGAVFAARPDGAAPPVDLPKPPVIAEKPAPEQKPDPESKPEVKPTVAFTTAPKLAVAWDLPVSNVEHVVWSPTGTHLALSGLEPKADDKNRRSIFLMLPYPAQKPNRPEPIGAWLGKHSSFVGFSPDGKHIITDMREYDLLSGYHKLHYWDVLKTNGGFQVKWPEGEWNMPTLDMNSLRSIDFDGREPRGYAFPPDGKTFRTMRSEYGDKGRATKMEVLEVDAVSGKTGKSLLKLDHAHGSVLSLDGKRLAVRDEELTKVTVYDVDRGAKLSEHKFPAEKLVSRPQFSSMMFSQDGRRLVVARGVSQTFVVNTDTGAALPTLEGLPMELTSPHAHAFSGDGRLLALACRKYKESRGVGGTFKPADLIRPEYLTVWDTETGKVLKMWSGSPRVAFCPTKPLLAILEHNGENETRVGFWDFAAEVEKK